MTRLIPNSTQIPNLILDHWMAELSGAEFKVLLYVARRTYGFGKDSDNISLNQMARGLRRKDGSALDLGTGLSRSGVKSACNSLIEKGILIRSGNVAEDGREPEESTYRLNLFAALPDDGEGEKPWAGGRPKIGLPGAEKSLPRPGSGLGGRPESDRGVGQKLALQNKDIQNPASSAPAGPDGEGGGADAAADFPALVRELVSHGVGRSVAERLARAKPAVCRRCLEYLPYAKWKSTKGAWLASAIEQEFGPPRGYEEARERRGRPAAAGASAPDPSGIDSFDLPRKKMERARVRYARMEKTQPEAILSFLAYAEQERARAERVAESLSPERRAEVLGDFDREERKLELFSRWLESGPMEASKPLRSHARA